MCTKLKTCSICLESNLDLITASETDDNNVKWRCKLRFCVPEVEWDDNCPVCQTCASQLDTFCCFRNRCLQSSLANWETPASKILSSDDCWKLKMHKCICSFCIPAHNITRKSSNNVDFSCYLCKESFTTKIALAKHIAAHAVNSCGLCREKFTTKTQLQLHVAQTHKETNEGNECRFCNRAFKSALSLKQHIRKIHQPQNCHKMDNSMEKRSESGEKPDNLKVESSSSTTSEFCQVPKDESKEYDECNNDEYPSADQEDSEPNDNSCFASEDIRVELDQKMPETKLQKKCLKQARKTAFACEECKNVFLSSKKLINHAIRTHGFDPSTIKPFQCDKCDRKFTTSSNLLQHKKYHMGKRAYICTFCGKGYITKSDLNTHEKQHLNRREYQCAGCPKTFNTNKDLRSHRLVVHTDPSLWNYVCSFCQKRFPIKSNRDQHMRRHTGEKRFGCHICEKRFVDKIVLQKHIKSHSNFRAFKCEHCAKEYKDSRVLEVHLTKVHGIGNAKIPVRVKKYFCHVCPKSYFAKNKLTRHMFSHTGEKPFVCHICDRKFTDKSYVKQHLKTTHNVFEVDENK